jgi:hypothetical protein
VASLSVEGGLGLNSDDAAATVGVAAPGIGAGCGEQISVSSEVFTGVT